MYISIQQYKDNVVTLTLTGRILQSMHRFEDLSDCIHVHEIPTSQKKNPKQNTKNQTNKQEDHWLHRSPEKKAQIKKCMTTLYH